MTGENVLQLIQSIKGQRVKKELQKKETRKKQKHQERNIFSCCNICAVIMLKKCHSCHNIKYSTSSKSGCKAGCKAIMILPAAAIVKTKALLLRERNLFLMLMIQKVTNLMKKKCSMKTLVMIPEILMLIWNLILIKKIKIPWRVPRKN